jgi:tripeptide aminopeptidase
MVQFAKDHADRIPNTTVHIDKYNNVFIRRGTADFYPCVSSHIDSVHPVSRKFALQQSGSTLTAVDERGKQVGFGGDDKTGVYICLEMLQRFDNICVALFSAEEIGCQGARKIEASLFDNVGYLMEFDCPARDMMSYTSGGVRLFDNHGDFIHAALPVLNTFGISKWQHHPYSDVLAIRKRFDFSCFNLSSGYYNWHRSNECVKIADTGNSLEMADALVRALGEKRYEFARDRVDESMPLVELSKLVDPVP